MFWQKDQKEATDKIGLILSGGGARAAYQVGVLKAIADSLPKDAINPFPIICGTSAGAINAAALGVYASQYREAVWRLVHVWGNFHVDQVFRADGWGLSASVVHWMTANIFGRTSHDPVALLDRAPLSRLLNHYLPFEKVQSSIDSGSLYGLCISASSYSTGNSVAFYQGHESIEPWARANRIGVPTIINQEHLMASSAIPFIFAPHKLDGEYYGDGSMRQSSPTSPALHMGADKLFVIGVKHEEPYSALQSRTTDYPTLGQVAGHVLDSIFLDSVSTDLERLERVNKTFSQIPDRHIPDDSATMRKVDALFISPSKDLYGIAERHTDLMPRSVRLFMKALGASKKRGSNLISYLLFEKAYCRELIALGYSDTMERKEEVLSFMNVESKP
ncbi:MAG: patatin-like phospholipase family protein [Gammaproteobacteria bacterium]|nr:patatin-like phospholipase family protein [Gammaproteobacteria bacterium]